VRLHKHQVAPSKKHEVTHPKKVEKNTHPHVARIRTASKSCPQQLHLSQPQAPAASRSTLRSSLRRMRPSWAAESLPRSFIFCNMRRSRWREFVGIQTPNEGSTDIDKDSTTTEKLRKLRKGFQTILGSTVVSGC